MAELVKPYTFTDETDAVAGEVNANFDALFDEINSNVVKADGSKEFTSIPTGPAADPVSANQLARKAYVDAVAKVRPKAAEAAMIGRSGTAAAGTQLIVQAGTISGTTSGAEIDITFPQPFPNGLLACVAVNGDAISGDFTISVYSSTLSKATMRIFNTSGNPYIGHTVRLDWIAIGW